MNLQNWMSLFTFTVHLRINKQTLFRRFVVSNFLNSWKYMSCISAIYSARKTLQRLELILVFLLVLGGPNLDSIDQGVKNYMVKIGQSQWKCAACGVFYNVTSNLRAHIESKHYSPGYKCPYCGLMLKTRNGCKHHIDNKHGIVCSHCHIQFNSRKLYNMHFATHQCNKSGNIWTNCKVAWTTKFAHSDRLEK